jgi:hypothetical protein
MRLVVVLTILLAANAARAEPRTVAAAFAPPAGFKRVELAPGSFGAYLRALPLRAPGTPVRSFRGDVLHEGDDPRIAAVVELDVGKRDLQQCADSIMRLSAEWRFATGRGDEIDFTLGGGSTLPWRRWARGERPAIDNRDRVAWRRGARADASHQALRAYLDVVYAYAGTASLAATTPKIARTELRVGDFFIQGGHPGHAVIVLDLAVDAAGHRRALLGQGFMPAQDFQVLAVDHQAWFDLDRDEIVTPFWRPFHWPELHRL